MMALFQAMSGFLPFGAIDGREFLGRDRGEACQRGGEDGTAHDQARRGDRWCAARDSAEPRRTARDRCWSPAGRAPAGSGTGRGGSCR
jgi:hypothetical protein